VLELILVNAVEPWLYGRSAGLSAIAIITAALFWTWLWGPVGLLLAVPLTVCIAVMGRYIPELGWLNVLLGVEPVLTPEARFYQRLVALDADEAATLATEYAEEHGDLELYDRVLIPALSLAESDRNRGALDAERTRFVVDTTRRIVEELAPEEANGEQPACGHACIVPASDQADELAAAMLARLVPGAQYCSSQSLASETLEHIGAEGCSLVCICAVPPDAASHAAYVARRVKKRFPKLRILVALCTAETVDKAKPRLLAAGVDDVVTSLAEARGYIRQVS
jgi:hypothetical protein